MRFFFFLVGCQYETLGASQVGIKSVPCQRFVFVCVCFLASGLGIIHLSQVVNTYCMVACIQPSYAMPLTVLLLGTVVVCSAFF